MMFRRRQPLHILSKLRGFLYPVMGIKRTLKYYRYRAVRLPGTPTNIALGLACGAAVSFTPFIGLHFILAFILAWLLGGNLLAAAIGTVVGNPLTFFFIWLLVFKTGQWMLGMDNVSASEALVEDFPDMILHGELFSRLDDIFEPIIIPMMVGCIPHFIWVWLLTFFFGQRLIAKYQQRKRHRLQLMKKRLRKKHVK